MPYAIAICAFFGAWLLAAGSVYQAAIELHRVQVDRAVYRLHRSHGLVRSLDERRSTRSSRSSG